MCVCACVCVCERERERETVCESGRGRERGGHRIQSRLQDLSPMWGLNPPNSRS